MSAGTEPARSDRVALDDPRSAWYVVAGTVDLFATRPGRPWRPLHSVEAGGLLVGLPPGRRGLLVMARAHPETMLERVALDALGEFEHDGRTGAQALDAGLSGLQSTLQTGLAPRRFEALDPGSVHELPAGSVARSTSIAWVSVLEGRVRALGRASSRGVSDWPHVLVDPNDWLEIESDAQVRATSTQDLIDRGLLGEPLARAQADAVRAIEVMLAREAEQEVSDLRRRRARSDEAARDIAREFAALIDPDAVAGLGEAGPPPLAAARLIGDHLGVAVEPPASWDAAGGSLEHLLHANHLLTRMVTLRHGWEKRDIGTLIALLGEDETPGALIHDGRRYVLHDPLTGARRPVDRAVAAEIGTSALMVYPPLPVGGLSATRMLAFGLHGTRRDIGRFLLSGLLIAGIGLLVPILTGRILGQLIPEGKTELISQLCLLLLLSAIVVTVLGAVQNLTATRLEGVLERRLQPAVWARLMELPSRVLRRYSTGDLATTALSVTVVRELLAPIWAKTVYSVILALVNMVLIFFYDVRLGLLAFVLLGVIVAVTVVAGRIELRNQRSIYQCTKELNSRAFQLIGHVPKLQASAAEDRAFAYWGRAFARSRRQTVAARDTQIKVAAFQAGYVMLGTLLAFVVVSNVIGGVSVGTFIAFIVALSVLLTSALMVAQTAIAVLVLVPPMSELGSLMREEPEVTEARAEPGELAGAIELSRVSHRYTPDGPLVLDDVSLSVAPGEFLAVVGPSGSGKSTVLRLMLGFEQPESGAVLYDEKDLADLDVGAVRRQCGVVLQDAQLLAGDIQSNIAGAGAFTLDDAWEAARQAGLAEDIEAMPMGMHTLLPEGASTISGGQRQRIMIARAIVSRPRIVMLDEATSALDNRTQEIVTESMRKLNATRVVIAHRLSTIQDADRIVVMQAGRVVQTGTYEELMAVPGLFHDLARRQIA